SGYKAAFDDLTVYDTSREQGGGKGRARLGAELRERKFDLALLLQNAFEAAWLAWRAGIPERIGYARDGRSLLLTKAVKVPREGEIPGHEMFYYLELLRRIGWIDELPKEDAISFELSEGSRQRGEELLLGAGARRNAKRTSL